MKCTKTCNNCRYRRYTTGYDQSTGMNVVMHSWCDKDKALMDSYDFEGGVYGHGNIRHFVDECESFEEVNNG